MIRGKVGAIGAAVTLFSGITSLQDADRWTNECRRLEGASV